MKGCKITIVGEYIAFTSIQNERTVKRYTTSVILPSIENMASVLKGKILPVALKKQFSDYAALRTFNVTKIEPLSIESKRELKDMPVMYMDQDALIDMIKKEKLGVDVSLYLTVFKLREAVSLAIENPEKFPEMQELRRASLEQDKILAELNPELYNLNDPNVKVTAEDPDFTPPVISGPSTPALSQSAHAKQTEDRIGGLQKDMLNTGELKPLRPEDV